MQKRRILINAVMTVLQTVVTGVTLFFLYKFLLRTIGVEQLGIWSLILATTSVSQIATFGLSGSIVKYVAKYVARDDQRSVSLLIQTAAISAGLFTAALLAIGYPIVRWILGLIVPSQSLGMAHMLLPYAFVSFWFMMATGISQAGLDGHQRIDLRSELLILGAIAQLVFCILLAPKYGLLGVAYATLLQNLMIFIMSWILLKKQLPLLPIIPHQWDRALFREIILYGMKFQLISFLSMFYDPLTKALMSRYGGLSAVGYYEMASKMIYKLRELINSANQTLVPAIAHLQEKTPEKIKSVYLITRELIIYLAFPLYSLVVITAPAISWLWIGHREKTFVIFCVVLSIGWLINTLSIPAHVTYLGIGELNWVLIGQVIVAISNIVLGFVCGILFLELGVVLARSMALILGSCAITISLLKKIRIPFSSFIPKEQRILGLTCLGTCIALLSVRFFLKSVFNGLRAEIIPICISSVIIVIPMWVNPMRKCMMDWMKSEFLSRRQHS